MAIADLALPTRLLAGGGPAQPSAAVLSALTTPVIGQFDPEFTVVMDDVMRLARSVFLTSNARCFAVSGQAPAGMEALLNTLLEPGDLIAVAGGSQFLATVGDCARRYGASAIALSEQSRSVAARFVVAPLIDPNTAQTLPIQRLAAEAHAAGANLLVDATLGLACCDFSVDAWGVDACAAGADYSIGAPSGMALVTYNTAIEAMLQARAAPPRTSYLDLLQLQAYWSPERLNHHTAPTSLVYGLREALRLLLAEGLEATIARHHQVGIALRDGLRNLGLDVRGDGPYALVDLSPTVDAAASRRKLLDAHLIYVTQVSESVWRLGLLGADATLANARRLILALSDVLRG